MTDHNSDDPHDLKRFVEAQRMDYTRALSELRLGQKTSHWMWYIFPQFAGLGFSHTSHLYSIKSLEEATAYLQHPTLGPRLLECCETLCRLQGMSARQIFSSPDDMKLRSCATLFSEVSPPGSVFARILHKYFDGKADTKTLTLLANKAQH